VIAVNDRVLTVRPESVSNDWMPEALLSRKWGVYGVVVRLKNGHGAVFTVRHDDGSAGYYEPRELAPEVVEPVQAVDRLALLLED